MSPRILLPLLVLLLAAADPAAGEDRPGRHEIRLRLEPAEARLAGSDRYTAPWRGRLPFTLREDLELQALRCGDEDLLGRVKGDRRSKDARAKILRVPRSCRDESGDMVLDFEFAGVIADEPSSEPSLHFVTGDRSTGIISERGAFLTGSSGFHPDFGGMALFDLVVDVPEGWSVASQGRVKQPAETAAAGRALFAYGAELPSDGLALSAGPYAVATRMHRGTLLRSFFFEEDEQRTELFLDAVASYLDRFEKLLGAYPHSKFDLVENFFTTGYGFPGYTLLGSRVVAMGPRALRPGYVDHEVAHCWLGNGVYLKPEGGNWCEGMTSYVANYLATEAEGAEAAAAYRRKVSQRYALAVTEETDFPPADFAWKSDDAGASIGYGKVSMIFHQLRLRLGEELFRKGLQSFVSRNLGRQAGWEDIESAFEDAAEERLDGFFDQWVNRAGLPRPVLASAEQDGDTVVATVTWEGEPYEAEVGLRIHWTDGSSTDDRSTVGKQGLVAVTEATGRRAARVELDPDWHLPRRIETSELPHSLARTLAAGELGHGLIAAYPIAPAEGTAEIKERVAAYQALAESAVAEAGGEALPALAVAEAEWNGSSLLLLGGPDENPLSRRLVDQLFAAGFDPTGEGFRAGTRRWFQDGDSLLVSLPHPDRAGATVTMWMPNGKEAMDRGRYLFYYGQDSWVALRGGHAAERGTAWPEDNPWRIELAKEGPPATTAARLRATVESLVDPQLEGRDAATTASRRTAERIGAELESAGLEPWEPRGFQQVFFWYLRDLPRQPKIFREERGRQRITEAYDFSPAPYWLPVPPGLMSAGGGVELADEPVLEPILIPIPEGLVFAGRVDEPAFRGLDLRSAAAVVVDDTRAPESEPARSAYLAERTQRYLALTQQVRRQEGETLIVIRPDDEPPFFAPLATYGSLDGERDDGLAAARAAGGERGLDRAVSRLHSSAPMPTVPVRLAFAGRELMDAMQAQAPLKPGTRWWDGLYIDLRMRIETHRVFDRNLIGLTVAMRRLSEGVVVVGAPHDGHGLDGEGRVQPGAVSNAAGTAVLLELARRFGEDPPPLTVAFASFGAKQWGLVGSRSLEVAWPGHWPIRALVNLDGLGRRGASPELVGTTGAPRVAASLRRATSERGLPLLDAGEDDGHDHWPFASAGLPALTLRQAGDGAEGVEAIDFEELASLVDALEAAIRELASGADS